LIDNELKFTLVRFFSYSKKANADDVGFQQMGVVLHMQKDKTTKTELRMYFGSKKGKSHTRFVYGKYVIKFLDIQVSYKKINAKFLVEKKH